MKNYLALPNGVPNADAFERIFEMLDLKMVTQQMRWILQSEEAAGKIIAFDGKTMCGSLKGERRSFHTVSAFLVDSQTVMGEVLCAEKSNEKREYSLEAGIDWLYGRERWSKLSGVGAVKSTITIKGITISETRCFITSLTSIAQLSHAVRAHWGIENCLHWHLDVSIGEDSSRIRNKKAAFVWNVLRKLAMEYLKKAQTGNASLKSLCKLAGWDLSFLEKVIFAEK